MLILDSTFFLVVVFLITVCHNGNVGAADIPFITAIILGILSFLIGIVTLSAYEMDIC